MKKTILSLFAAVMLCACTAPPQNENLPKEDYEKASPEEAADTGIYYPVTTVADVEGIKSLSDFFAEEDSLKRLKNMNFNLKKEYDFYEMGLQPLYCTSKYEGDLKFVDADNAGVVNQEITDENYYTPLKTIQADIKITDKLSDKIDKGEALSNEDFIITSENDVINVILGSSYDEYYSVGDTLDLDFYNKEYTFCVKGFFKPDTVFKNGYPDQKDLNNCIMMPYISTKYEPENDREAQFQKILYSQKNLGVIKLKTDDERSNISLQIEEQAKEYDLPLELGTTPLDIEY